MVQYRIDREREDQRTTLSEEYFREQTVGELRSLSGPICVVDYDPEWPQSFEREAERIRKSLGGRALRLEHVGSTSVPELPAKSRSSTWFSWWQSRTTKAGTFRPWRQLVIACVSANQTGMAIGCSKGQGTVQIPRVLIRMPRNRADGEVPRLVAYEQG